MSNWDESAHPRVPGGKVNGGQFTSKESGGTSPFRGKRQEHGIDYEVHLSDELSDADKKKFYDYFEGTARVYLGDAQTAEAEWGAPPVTYIFKDGHPYSFYQGAAKEVEFQPGYEAPRNHVNEERLGNKPYEVKFLGSAGPGGGSVALLESIRDAYIQGATGFFLNSAIYAVGFYEKMGMHRESKWHTQFHYTKEELGLLYKEIEGLQ